MMAHACSSSGNVFQFSCGMQTEAERTSVGLGKPMDVREFDADDFHLGDHGWRWRYAGQRASHEGRGPVIPLKPGPGVGARLINWRNVPISGD
jgi:hypothetical protein